MLINGGARRKPKPSFRLFKKSILYWYRQLRFHKGKLLLGFILIFASICFIQLVSMEEIQLTTNSETGPHIPPGGIQNPAHDALQNGDPVIPPEHEQDNVNKQDDLAARTDPTEPTDTIDDGPDQDASSDQKVATEQKQVITLPVDVDMHEVYRTLKYDNIDGGAWKQGWPVTYPKSALQDTLHVFVIPHSHNDPGWIKTFQEYYETQTRYILNNIVDALLRDHKRKFIWAEVSFFKLWWDEQSTERRAEVKKLFHDGQLEFVTGGWVMNDEANTNLYAMLSQMLAGIHWVDENLDIAPKHGWAIDPFGHTPTMGYVLKQLGLESLLIQRVHYRIKKYLAENKNLEFLWRQSWNPSSEDDIVTHLMPFYSYDIPHTCGPEPAICCEFDFARLRNQQYSCPANWNSRPVDVRNGGSDLAAQTKKLVDQYRKKAELYKTNYLLVPLGDDFRYTKKDETSAQFENYEAIFEYANNNPSLNVNLQFGTLSDYFKNILRHEAELPVLTGSFFTYADINHDYWSGYYTTRAYYKNMDRILETQLYSAEVLCGLALAHGSVDGGHIESLQGAHQSLGVFQHHDGITGTAKDHVVVDYGKMLLTALVNTRSVIGTVLNSLTKRSDSTPGVAFQSVWHQDGFASLPEAEILESDYQLVLFNSRNHNANEVVIQYSRFGNVCVMEQTEDGDVEVEFQLNKAYERNPSTKDIYEISFVADLGPLSVQSYKILDSDKCTQRVHAGEWVTLDADTEIVLSNENEEYNFDKKGLLQSVKIGTKQHKLQENFMMYSSKGGAYLFVPSPQTPAIYQGAKQPTTVKYLRGPYVQEVHFVTPIVHRIARLTPVSSGISMEHIVDVSKENNKEFIVRYSTNLKTNSKVHADLNGFQIETYHIRHDMPTQHNYFPMPNMMAIRDEETGRRFTVHTSHSSGAGSIRDGELEVMLDRTLTADDARGLGQGVTDNVPARLKYTLLFEEPQHTPSDAELSHRFRPSLLSYDVLEELNHPLELFYRTDISSIQAPAGDGDLCLGSCETIPAGDFRVVKWDVHSKENQKLWIQKYDYEESFACVKNCETVIPRVNDNAKRQVMNSGAMLPFSLKEK